MTLVPLFGFIEKELGFQALPLSNTNGQIHIIPRDKLLTGRDACVANCHSNGCLLIEEEFKLHRWAVIPIYSLGISQGLVISISCMSGLC